MFVVWSNALSKSKDELASDDIGLLEYEEKYCGIPAVFKSIEKSPHGFKYDKRLTGSSCIDEVLQEVRVLLDENNNK